MSLLEADQFKVTRKATSYSIKKGAIRLNFTDSSGNLLAYCEATRGRKDVVVFSLAGIELLRIDKIHGSESAATDANAIFDERGIELALLKGEKTGVLSTPRIFFERNGTTVMTYEYSRKGITLSNGINMRATIQTKGLIGPKTFEVSIVHDADKDDRILIIGLILLLQAMYM